MNNLLWVSMGFQKQREALSLEKGNETKAETGGSDKIPNNTLCDSLSGTNTYTGSEIYK